MNAFDSRHIRILTFAAISAITMSLSLSLGPAPASAQGAACPNPAFEKRLIDAITVAEPKITSKLSTAKARPYATCYARTACGKGLSKVEFEMFALGVITSYGDEKAEEEYGRRMRRDGKQNESAMRKVNNLNDLQDRCMKEVGA